MALSNVAVSIQPEEFRQQNRERGVAEGALSQCAGFDCQGSYPNNSNKFQPRRLQQIGKRCFDEVK
jgi:hypothetical protein